MNAKLEGSVLPIEYSLDARFAAVSGTVFLTGIQALVRVLVDRERLDSMRGLQTAGFVSGYRGSPLGGLDMTLAKEGARLEHHRIKFEPGINEDLAAAAVWGSQQVGLFPGALHDGVFSMWYGKAPGLDLSCDAFRHANMAGTACNGGVLAVVGDDPSCKSSSLPSSSLLTLRDLMVPILTPVDVQDTLDLGRLGFELSRYSGAWTGLIASADTMDSGQSIDISLDRHRHDIAGDADDVSIRLEDSSIDQEARMVRKLDRAARFATKTKINRIESAEDQADIAIVTYGKTYADVRETLSRLGFATVEDLTTARIRLVRFGMPWPIDPAFVQAAVDGVAHVIVVEEKHAFLEDSLKATLFDPSQTRPHITGKRDANGNRQFAPFGTLGVAHIQPVFARYLAEKIDPAITSRCPEADAFDAEAPERKPIFCAGCPHSISARLPDGSRATAGIGCHYMAQWLEENTALTTHMGAEGTTWIGQSAFTSEKHIFANLGDGTYAHSGILAIRASIVAGVNITYKILYNDAVAMTGGQAVDGGIDVATIIEQVRAEGVRVIHVVTDDPSKYRDVDYPVSDRRELDAVQRQMRDVEGSSVLIFDQTCAAEKRRRRKRGSMEPQKRFAFINTAVCDDCGDCSRISHCVAIEPKPTALGLRRAVNQSVCNGDLSCVEGFCPAFLTIDGALDTPAIMDRHYHQLPPPTFHHPDGCDVLITGVGGTGIVTVSQLLGYAAHIEGLNASTLDMTGLAQKGGSVVAHVRMSRDPIASNHISPASADVLIAADLVTAAQADVLSLAREETFASVNSTVAPTAGYVLYREVVDPDSALGRLRRAIGSIESRDIEAASREAFGTTQYANIVLLGLAYQSGAIPLSTASIEQAIQVNGVEIERNIAAFRFGRLLAINPHNDATVKPTFEDEHRVRLDYLVDYQNDAFANAFDAFVQEIAALEERTCGDRGAFTEAAAESYFHLLAIKDEYEVARLSHLSGDSSLARDLKATFAPGFKLAYRMAPPFLGEKKRSFGAWIAPVFRVLASMKRLRGSRFDPFRSSADRRLDASLRERFKNDLERLGATLDETNRHAYAAYLEKFQEIRGYGHVRAQNAERVLTELDGVGFEKPAEVRASSVTVAHDPVRIQATNLVG